MNKNYFKGKKIAITSIDLEQSEHRGIASVTKSLIKLLNEYGAEVYLITGLDTLRTNYFKNLFITKKLNKEIFISDCLSSLQKGHNYREKFKKSFKYKVLKIKSIFISLINLFINNYRLTYKVYDLNETSKLINIKDTRLDYINYTKGFISSKNIFNLCRLRSMRLIFRTPLLNLNKDKIDLIITSCPLSLASNIKKHAKVVQLIHDAIPIQVSSHPEDPITFYNRLNDAHKKCSCIYVSKESKRIVRKILELKNNNEDQDIINPLPSLSISLLNAANDISTIRSIQKPYILFNSSIVERKRVEIAIKYFKNSNLIDRGFLFCIAGKLHDNKYSEFIKNIARENTNILLLNYVDEIEKVWLFLNASLFISTSSTEGFGVPVLDALSIDLPTLASNIPTYLEIKSIKKNNNLKLININEDDNWVKHLNELKPFEVNNLQNKLNRINNFKKILKDLEERNINNLSKLI